MYFPQNTILRNTHNILNYFKYKFTIKDHKKDLLHQVKHSL